MQATSNEARKAAQAKMAAFETEAERGAYAAGCSQGHGIACHNAPTLGKVIWTESLGRVTVDADNIREVHEAVCFEAEAHSRQYSPWEYTAAEFNELEEGESEAAWEAYEEGVADAIRGDLATYTDEDYGISAGN